MQVPTSELGGYVLGVRTSQDPLCAGTDVRRCLRQGTRPKRKAT
jgi:hypothetical protein